MALGSLIWLAERRQNSLRFPLAIRPCFANGMWFALVTLTTVGYGDKAPVTRVGKAITAAWMVISLIAVSSITAGLASTFTCSCLGRRMGAFNRQPHSRVSVSLSLLEPAERSSQNEGRCA